MANTRVAVIGSGPSGLAALVSFKSAADSGQPMPELVCFERQSNWGGQWNYSWRTGYDEFGEPVHSGMYKFLWINVPRQAMELPNYTYDEHFGKNLTSYVSRQVIMEYIQGRANKFNVQQYIRFATSVRNVYYDKATEKFTISAFNHIDNTLYHEEFDYVIAATGVFNIAYVPNIDGIEAFEGRVMHAHDFRDAREFKDQNVLLIGSSYSGQDIASQCYKYGSKSVTISYKGTGTGLSWPSDFFTELPEVTRIQGNTVTFQDGTQNDFDSIILCTGYQCKFPYLPDDLRLNPPLKFITPIYKGVVWQKNPKMFYIGAFNQSLSFPVFDVQAWYIRDIILQKIHLPNEDQMDSEIARWVQIEGGITCPEDVLAMHRDYIRELSSDTDYPEFDVEKFYQILCDWLQRRRENMITFRNTVYESAITGTRGLEPKTPWLETLGDEMDLFLAPN